jgi:ABC-type uncharacterized transport system involved in gliding motility auxiliary subunit
VIVGSRDPFVPAEVDVLNAYVRASGRLLLLATPLTRGDPNPLLEPWGIRFTGGVVTDPARSQDLDPQNVIVEDFPSVNPIDNGVSRLQLPISGGLLLDVPSDRTGLTVSRLARTSDASWVETRPDEETARDPLDIPGPVLVAAAADDSRVATGSPTVPGGSGARIERTRVVAVGDSIFVTNQVLDNLSNGLFLLNAVNWLAEEEQLVATTSRPNPSRPLPLTPERQARILVVTVGLVPGAVVGAGLLLGVLRRRRAR